MIRVANREVVHTVSLLLSKDEDAWLNLPILKWEMKLHVVFVDREPEEGKPPEEATITIEAERDHGKLQFINWNSQLGTATTVPIEVASSEGKSICMMVYHKKTGESRQLELQFSVK